MRLAVNTLYSILGAAVPIAVTLVTVPLYLRLIGGDRYGALMIAWLLLGYFGQADFGIARAITQRISVMGPDRAQNARTVWSGLIAVLGFSVVSAVLVYLTSGIFFGDHFKVEAGLRAEMMAARWALALCIPVIATTSVFCGALMGLERFKVVSAGNLASSIAMQIFPLLTVVFLGGSLNYLIISALVGRALGLLITGAGAWFVMLRGQPISATMEEFRHLFSFGAWIMLTMIVAPIMTMADRLVIGATLGAAAVTAYAVPFQIASRSAMFPYAASQALFPRFASDGGARSLELCRSTTALIGQLYAPIVIGLSTLAAPLLVLWLGSRLDMQSILIGQIVLLGFWTNAIASVPYAYIQARGNPRLTAVLHVAEIPFYIALLYLLGIRYGLAGVAAAYSIRCAVDCLILIGFANLWTRDLAFRLAGPLALSFLSILAGQLFQTWPGALASAALLGTAATLLAFLQMPEEVRERLRRLPFVRRAASEAL